MRPYFHERTVFYDNDLLNLYLKMPPEYRADESIWKNAVRILDKDIAGVIDANTGCSPFAPYPVELMNDLVTRARNKYGLNKTYRNEGSFPTYSYLIRESAEMKELVVQTLCDQKCIDPEIFDVAAIRAMLDSQMRGNNEYSWMILLLVTFGRWYRLYCG